MNIKKSKYLQVKPANVITVWQCPRCKVVANMSTDNIQSTGIPVCFQCDDTMEFKKTLVKKTSVRMSNRAKYDSFGSKKDLSAYVDERE